MPVIFNYLKGKKNCFLPCVCLVDPFLVSILAVYLRYTLEVDPAYGINYKLFDELELFMVFKGLNMSFVTYYR